MINNTKFSIAAMAMIVSSVPPMVIAEEKNGGFIEDSSLTVLNRNYYFNREHRNGESSPTGNGYSEAWANAIITKFESGFTLGTIGVGVDAFAMIGIKLDTGGGRNGGRSSFDVLPVNSNGEARDEYTKVGGAAKIRAFDTVVKVGDVFPSTPVVAAGDSRLLPESFTGVTATNTSIEGLTVQGGRLHAMSQPVSSNMRDNFATFYAGPVNSPWVGYFGGDYNLNKNVTLSLYSSRLKDAWNQYYAGTGLNYSLSNELSVFGGLNYYKAVDEGKKLLGDFDNNIWSGKVGVKYGAHTLALSHQRNNGNNDFDYLRQSDSIFLDNSIQ